MTTKNDSIFYFDIQLKKYVEAIQPFDDFIPYFKKVDVIVKRYLSYKFDKPGKENQSFKEFLNWFIEAERKVLHPENFASVSTQLRYTLLRYIFTVKKVISHRYDNPFYNLFPKFKSKKVKNILGFSIETEEDVKKITNETLRDLGDLIEEVTFIYSSLLNRHLISTFMRMNLSDDESKILIDPKEFSEQEFKVKYMHNSDVKPVLELILGIDQIFISIPEQTFVKCCGAIPSRCYRNMFLALYTKYRKRKFSFNDKIFHFMHELFIC